MRYLLIFFFLSISCVGIAGENRVFLRDGSIVIDTEDGKKLLDYSRLNKYSDYGLNNWSVKEEADLVEEAIRVYKRKGRPRYRKKVSIINRLNGDENIIVKYTPRKRNDRVIFSPDENFMYYIALSNRGDDVVYGLNLLTKKKFVVDSADDFVIVNCDGECSYIVTNKNTDMHYVYTLEGAMTDAFRYGGNLRDVSDVICH